MELTKETLKRIIKEELQSVLSEAIAPNEVEGKIMSGEMNPGEKFTLKVQNYVKTPEGMKEAEPIFKNAIFIGKKGDPIPKDLSEETVVFYLKPNGDVSSQQLSSMKQAARMDRMLRKDDTHGPYRKYPERSGSL